MYSILIDTSALFAIVDADDDNHANAIKFLKGRGKHASLVVTDVILLESMTLIKSKLGQTVAVQAFHLLHESPRYQLIQLAKQEWADTWTVFEKFEDKDWSPVDCSCLVVAQRRGIRETFAFDKHFRQMQSAGILCVP